MAKSKLPKQPCETIYAWLRENLGSGCLAPLTGTDARALLAAVQIVELYSVDRDLATAEAFALVVLRMQKRTEYLAYHAIAHVLDWGDREALWTLAGLDLNAPGIDRVCVWEPGGAGRMAA